MQPAFNTPVAERFRAFGKSIFAEMTAMAAAHKAVNLSQGFPDFDGPPIAREAAIAAINAGHSQYARMIGVPALNQAIARSWARAGRGEIDPEAHVTVTAGCSEAIGAALVGLLNPGDEVIIFEPYFDFYTACAAMAGAVPRVVTLHPPGAGPALGGPAVPAGSSSSHFWFDEAQLRAAFTPRTRAIIVNTPHNPTGKVFSRAELELIASLCRQHNVVAISDEVYEHLTFDASQPHISLATLPGMWERTITLSSLGKTFSLTGWKVGWSIAPPALTACVRAAHQFMVFSGSTPMQHGAIAVLDSGDEYIAGLKKLYASNRDMLSETLRRCGLTVFPSYSTYFLMADHTALGYPDDRAFCEHLTKTVGVAAIPPSVFYLTPGMGKNLVRFAFCKREETMREACERLRRGLKPRT
ncbi:MAG: aminotransferase class I/II-fold pyridoxal phosphate-dependent enzyme [Phycisphaerales bacterium]|jgi:aspartate/methionine/tyrosine aminotransferase